MPQYYDMYARDPDYLGALTMWDTQLGRLMGLLRTRGVADDTVILYTADNGPHQGHERSDIRWSTAFLRQCKASMWEGGIRVPGLLHYPRAIASNVNVTTPATTADFLPTILSVLQVESDNPEWVLDGLDLLPLVAANPAPRRKPIGFDSTGGEHALIDNNWKILVNPKMGQCDPQPPYSSWKNLSKLTLLFNLDDDYHELHDRAKEEPQQFERMKALLDGFLLSVKNSQANETKCGPYAPSPSPAPPSPPRTDCAWSKETGLEGSDIDVLGVTTKEGCCGACWARPDCAAADFTGGKTCHLKEAHEPKPRHDGSISCVPKRSSSSALLVESGE